MDESHGAQIARSQSERERLAKEWLLRLMERTPLDRVGDLPLGWFVDEAPALIGDIVDGLQAPGDGALEEAHMRAQALGRMRGGSSAAEQISLDLAALQSLLLDSLRSELPGRAHGDFAHAAERLAEIFARMQGALATSLIAERAADAPIDELTGLPGKAQLHEWMSVLAAGQERYGHGFAVAVIDVDGLARINDAFGREAGDRLVRAIGAVIRSQARASDLAFRLDEDEFAVLAPHTDVDGLASLARRVADLVDESQAPDGPRLAVVAGVVAFPGDADSVGHLLDAAEEATYAAKASGQSVATGLGRGPRLQDS